MAVTFASYAAPTHTRMVGVAAVVALTAVNYRGVQKSVLLTRVIVALTLTALTCGRHRVPGRRPGQHRAPDPVPRRLRHPAGRGLLFLGCSQGKPKSRHAMSWVSGDMVSPLFSGGIGFWSRVSGVEHLLPW